MRCFFTNRSIGSRTFDILFGSVKDKAEDPSVSPVSLYWYLSGLYEMADLADCDLRLFYDFYLKCYHAYPDRLVSPLDFFCEDDLIALDLVD